MRAVVALGLLAVASCDLVFGLDGHELAPDSGSGTITGTFVRQVIANNSQHLPTPTESGLTSPELDLELRVGSATTNVPVDSSGSFEAATAVPYALAWTLDGGVPIELQSSAPVLELVDLWVGRADRTPVTKPTTLTFDVPSVGSDEFVAVQGTGLWADIGANEAPGATMFGVDWHAVTDAHHTPGLLDASQNDRLYALFYHHIKDATHDYDQLVAYFTADITQTDGTSDAVTNTPTALGLSPCTEIVASPTLDGQRLAAANPAYVPHDSSWAVVGIPIGARDNTGINYLAGNSQVAIADVDSMIHYDDPFPGVTEVAAMTASLTRSVQLGGAAPTTFTAASFELDQVLNNCQATTLGGRLAAIVGWSVAGQSLAADGASLTVDRTADVDASFMVSSGAADYYQIDLVQLGVSAGATTATVIRTYWTTDPVVHVDPALLVPGTTYALTSWVQVGVPGATTGNFKSLAFPRGFTVTTSPTFTVAN